MLNIHGNDIIAHWAYSETISSHVEHPWNQYNIANCLESRIGYKVPRLKIGKKRMGDKEQRRKIGNRGQETRNKEVRHGTEDGRKGTEMWDWGRKQRAENKVQRRETGNRGWETRNKELRHGTEGGRQGTETWERKQRIWDKEQTLETGYKGR